MNANVAEQLNKKVRSIHSLPTPPVIFQPLLGLLQQPADQVNLKEVTRLVSYDESLAAMCLRIANSPLFGRAKTTESVQAAVLSLGIRRVGDILLTCCMQQMMPRGKWATDPAAFWRHSLGCALVTRKFAEMIEYPDVEKAYVAGLLHDLGIVVNSVTYPEEFSGVLEEAAKMCVPLLVVEEKRLGFTHCESGLILAETWRIPPDIRDVIQFHHGDGGAFDKNPLVSLVHLCDLLCRMRSLGYGYYEAQGVDFAADEAWLELAQQFPRVAAMDLARFTFDLDAVVGEVTDLVNSIFAPTEAS
jgi:putative nucleotidyltransferase with HDIG domain